MFLILCLLESSYSSSLRGERSTTVIVPTKKSRGKAQSFTDVIVLAQRAAFKGGIFAATAGVIQVITLMWLRTAVNYQYRYGVPMITALRELYKQGGIPRFYKGVSYAIVLAPISKFGGTAANEGSRVLVAWLGLSAATGELYATILGTFLTVLWKLFLMPLETCKTVLQVDGSRGFEKLMSRISRGNIWALYHGSAAAILSTAASHYPWFYTYNFLDHTLSKTDEMVQVVFRSALIGFIASAVSDTVSNFLRILKTVKQSTSADGLHSLSYLQITRNVYKEGGLVALLFRGLGTRIITNGIQSILFTVLWKVLPLLWEEKNSN